MTAPSRLGRRSGCLIGALVAAGLVVVLVIVLIASYNGLVDKETEVDRSFADLDAQLQRRNDLIPNLVGAVRGVLGQEQAVFGDLAEARTRRPRRIGPAARPSDRGVASPAAAGQSAL